MKRLHLISRLALAVFFVVAGINHFRSPLIYWSMMPPWLPWPEALNLISGAAEIAGGLGVIFSQTRIFAGWWLIALLVAVFPANVHVAVNGWTQMNIPQWVLWVRLPIQLLIIAWVYKSCLRRRGSG